MTTNEIKDRIKAIGINPASPSIWDVLSIIDLLNNRVEELEKRLESAEGSARHANNIASCLANGIIPD